MLASRATSTTQLLAFRGLMGVGAAFIMASTLSLLTSVFPPQERSKAIAVWTGFAGAGGVIGTLVGGLVLISFWWGSVFFVSVPIALLALILATVMCPSSKEELSQRLDPVGAVLPVTGFGALLHGIIEGPEKGWGSLHSVVSFIIAALAPAGFVLWERRSSERSAQFRALHDVLMAETQAPFRDRLRVAVKRGELQQGVDIETLMSALAGPLFYRRLIVRHPLSKGYVDDLVDLVLGGAAPCTRQTSADSGSSAGPVGAWRQSRC